MRKSLLFTIIYSLFSAFSFGQDFTNKGKDFWVGYGYHQVMTAGNSQDMVLYFATDQITTITVSIPGLAYSATYSNIPANTVFTTPPIPKTGSDARLLTEGLSSKGIHVVATKPIVAYAHIYNSSVSGACVLLPTNTLGKEYYSINYKNVSNSNNANSWFYVVATEPGTTSVEIIPSANTIGGWVAGSTYTVNLTQGQIYNVMGALLPNTGTTMNPVYNAVDLTGSRIKSISSGTGGCKKIAVFSGSGRISITCPNTTSSSSDNYMVQAFPKTAWGRKFLTATTGVVTTTPASISMTNNIYRICVSSPAAIVKINNVVTTLPLQNGFYYETAATNVPLKIESDSVITVAQYVTSQNACGNGNPGDPEVIYLSPVEQNIKKVLFNSNLLVAANPRHFVNAIIPNGGTALSSFRIDGVVPSVPFTVHPQDPAFSFIKIPNLALGGHTLVSDSGFNAIAYGFASAESYGYNAGTNVLDLIQSNNLVTQYGLGTSPTACTGAPFKFRISLGFKPLKLTWNLNTIPGMLPNNNIVIQNPDPTCTLLSPAEAAIFVCPDSITIVNGKEKYWYSLPTFYTINTIGTYTVNIDVLTSNTDGCGTNQDIDFDLEVSPPPVAELSFTQPGCFAESVQFSDVSNTTLNYRWYWTFGEPSSGNADTSYSQNPTHTYAGPGTYNVRFASITTPGCLSDTITRPIVIPDFPSGTISGNTSLCQNASQPTITFSGSLGTRPYEFTYNIITNGVPGPPLTIQTNGTSNSVTLLAPTNVVGSIVYNLTSIKNLTSALCVNPITNQTATVTINPLPTAAIAGSTIVCQGATDPIITFTGANGTAPFTFTYNIDGGANQTITTTSGNSVTLTVSTANIGTFTYNLVAVVDGSSTLCSNTASGSAVVTVQETSTATISGTASVCQDANAPIITFTAANGTAPFTFSYNINGGATQTIVTSATSNSASITVPMTAAGTFVYSLLSVQNTGPTICITPITGTSATVVINPNPTATIAGSTNVCQNTGTQNITFTGLGGTAPYTFTYIINGGVPQTVTTTVGNSVTVAAPSSSAGTFVYELTQVQDASSTICTRSYSNTTATVIVNQIATASISGTTTVCQAGTAPVITFTAVGGVAPYIFSYTLNGVPSTVTTTVGNSVTITLPTTTAGTFVYNLVSVRESSSLNCVNNQTGTVTIVVYPKPTASYTTTAPYCAQKAITFTPSFGITPTGSVVSWIWNYGDGTGTQIRTDGNPFTLTYPTAGVKPVSFKVVSDNGCESDLAITPAVIINSKPKAGFINPEACLADAFAQFTDTSTVVGGSIVFWEWDFGDGTPILAGSTPAIKNPLHAFLTVGNKTVKLIVTTNSGCKDTITQSFFINGEVTSADFIAQNGGNFCSNRPVQIKENSVVNVGGLIRVDIYWDNIGAPATVVTDNLPTPGKIYTHNYPNLQVDRTYNIRYIAYSGFNGVCQKEVTKSIIVRASPVALFATPIDVCLNGGPVQLLGSEIGGVGGTSTYIGTGVSPSGLFNPLTATPGTYNITFTAISPNGCDSALVRPIRVLAPPVADFTTVGNLCAGGPGNVNVVTFSQTSTAGQGGAIVKWIYDWGDGTPVQTFTTGANVTHAYATAGPKTAYLIVEDAYGCRNAAPGKRLDFTVNPLPVPSYTITQAACLPLATIVFTNTTPAPLAGYTFNWSFDLPSIAVGNTSTLTSPSHTYTTQGPFNTQLVATINATGCKDSTIVRVINGTIINPEPVVVFAPLADICLNNGTRQLTQGSQTNVNINGTGVYTGPGVSASGLFNPLLVGAGTYQLTYTFTSTPFGCTASATRSIKVLAPPIVDTFITIGNLCEQNAIIFHNAVLQGDGTITSWIYDWNDGSPLQTVSNGADVTHIYANAGTYVPTLYVTTNDGCKSAPAKPVTVVVNTLPKPDFIFSPSACLPQAKIDFTNTTPPQSIGGLAYQWVFDDVPPTIKTTVNADFTYTTLGSHPVQLIATNSTTFCTASKIKDISNSLHPAPFANFNFTKPNICIGDNVGVIDRSTFADGTPTSWNWNWGDNTTSVGQNPSNHVYTSPLDNYSVTLKVTNSFGCIDDTTRIFAVYELPAANAGKDSVILLGGNLTLTPIVTGRNLTYAWSGIPAPENLSSKIIKNPIASPIEDITYKLVVTGIGGCIAPADFVFIKVLKSPVIPNTFTPNNDGVHDTWIIKYLESYPENRVQVFTRTGQLVFESRRYLKPWDGNLNGKPLPFDTYYYIIEPGSGRTPMTGYVTIVK